VYITYYTHYTVLSAYPCPFSELIEHMIIPFASTLERDPRLFQQVILDNASFNHPFAVEAYLHELTESTGIVVTCGLGVSCALKTIVGVRTNFSILGRSRIITLKVTFYRATTVHYILTSRLVRITVSKMHTIRYLAFGRDNGVLLGWIKNAYRAHVTKF
jgi:hypothetical protein